MDRVTDSVIRMPQRRMFSALDMHAFAIGSVAALVFFVGYGLKVDFLTYLIPGFPPMRPRTAFAIMLLSLACILSLRGTRRSELLSAAIAAGTIIWLMQLVVRNWGVENEGESIIVPIQATLASVILGGLALLIINLAPRRGLVAAAMALAAVTPALYRILALILFRGAPVVDGSLMSSMGLHTAILIVWFMTACILMHPKLKFGEAFYQSSLRGRLLRRALPVVVVLPVVMAAASLSLSVVFKWQVEGLFALSAAMSVIIGAGLIWWLSRLASEWQTEANEHASRLQRANEALEQYASSAAHDLKAPVRHIMLYGELLDEALARADMAGAKSYAANIRSAASELPGMIDGMLEYSRSGFSRLAPADHSLSELVQAAATMLETDLKAAGGKVRIEREAMLWCDAQLMTAVFQNLIANSLAHRRPDRPLQVRIDAERDAADGPGRWEISVADNGVGFDPEFASVAFNPLARGVKLAGDGSGIGLATCRTILQSHGGQIRVDPSFKGGARIEILLPAKA